MVLVLACSSLVVSGVCGLVFILQDRRGFVTVRAGTMFGPSAPLVDNLGLPRAVSWLGLIAAHVNLRLPQAFTVLRRFRRRVFCHRRVPSCFALMYPWLRHEHPQACGAA